MTNEEAIALYARDLSVGQHKRTCPSCSDTRKNKSDKSLSVNVDGNRAVYNCHYCGMNGIVPFHEREIVQMHNSLDHHRVKKIKQENLSPAALGWLQARGIKQATAEAFGLKSTEHYISSEGAIVPSIVFPYTSKGQHTGAKIRSIAGKGFSCTNPLRHFFNVDSLVDNDSVIICEGEMDALAIHQVGYEGVISVPNGAVQNAKDNEIDPEQDNSFRFLWDVKDKLDSACKIIIATDGDKQGSAMAEEIARRIGRDRCWKVEWPAGCKDANDVLLTFGEESLSGVIGRAKPWPISGIYEASNFSNEIMDIYHNGFGSGFSTGYENVDELYTVVAGQLTVVTGVPSSGKSEFIDQIMVNMAQQYGERFAICSFENEPRLHIAKLIAKHVGKPFFDGQTQRLSQKELDEGLEFVNDHFTFLYQNDGSLSSMKSIVERLKIAVMRHGIRGAVIDPYNYISRPNNVHETEWISDMLTQLRVFAQAHDIHIWFVAHPTKMARENGKIPVPKGYDISGSAAWFAKADCGLTVHRPDPESTLSEVHLWKVRFQWVGKQGHTSLTYDRATSRYRDNRFERKYARGDTPKDDEPISCPF
jgi:twinkle protein